MNISGYKCLTIALGVVCVGLLVFCGFLFWSHGWLIIRPSGAAQTDPRSLFVRDTTEMQPKYAVAHAAAASRLQSLRPVRRVAELGLLA